MARSDLRHLSLLLDQLWRVRAQPGGWLAGLLRRWRERRLMARLDREWPGGFTRHPTGDLVYVPAPLGGPGRRALLQPPEAHPAALAFLRPGAVAIDIGAELGGWTVPFARAVGPSGRVLALEPEPRFAGALDNTLTANGLRQAEIVCCAAGDRDAADASETGPAVPLRRLDSLAAERRLPRLDLVKITVAGHERQVLDGAEEVLDRFRPVLVIETGREGAGDRPAIHYRLRHLGYRILGILLDHGMAEAAWPAYIAQDPPFDAATPRHLLLIPEEE